MIIIFVLGYMMIALEHPIRINKSATALFLAVCLWILLIAAGTTLPGSADAFGSFHTQNPLSNFKDWLTHHVLVIHLGEISEILFFLLGAMTIVELIDAHAGFRIITDRITTTNRVKLLWIISIITFCLSAVLDNLTTSIVMVALLRKLITEKKERWFFAGMVIIAANSGGAFSPIGDVTTIMLWIGGQITTINIIIKTLIPSMVSMIIPLAFLSYTLKGEIKHQDSHHPPQTGSTSLFERNFVFFLGIGSLLFVPVFKTITHLPPYIGILFGLSVLWITTEIMHKSKNEQNRSKVTISGIINRIDTPSILFFLGILLAVAALQTAGHLDLLATSLDKTIGNLYVINVIIGLLSSVVDNVPLVAGAIGMYHDNFPTDHYFWEMLAYCAGTGGSILIIGSAAGVAVMGMEKIDFIWYLKNVSFWALIGYFSGCLAYWLMSTLIFHS